MPANNNTGVVVNQPLPTSNANNKHVNEHNQSSDVRQRSTSSASRSRAASTASNSDQTRPTTTTTTTMTNTTYGQTPSSFIQQPSFPQIYSQPMMIASTSSPHDDGTIPSFSSLTSHDPLRNHPNFSNVPLPTSNHALPSINSMNLPFPSRSPSLPNSSIDQLTSGAAAAMAAPLHSQFHPTSLNLLNPTPQQRLTIERLLQIPPETIRLKNPKLFELLTQLRKQYLWQAVTTPITTNETTTIPRGMNLANKDNTHPLERMKQEDAMVFASHIDSICDCVNGLIQELDLEEYELVNSEDTYSKALYRTIPQIEDDIQMKAKRDVEPPSEDDAVIMHDEDEEEEEEEDEEEEFEEEELPPTPYNQLSSSTAPIQPIMTSIPQTEDCEDEDEIANMEEEEEDDEDEDECEEEQTVNAQSQDSSNGKLQEFFRQLENVEPIPNGKLSFFQNHHLVVGKFDRKELIDNNTLVCTVMKKSTLNVVVHRRCTRLKNDNDVNSRFAPFDSTAANYQDKRILKKQSLAKSVVRFAKVKVDFGNIVCQLLKNHTVHTGATCGLEQLVQDGLRK